jgi:hypothetical protein
MAFMVALMMGMAAMATATAGELDPALLGVVAGQGEQVVEWKGTENQPGGAVLVEQDGRKVLSAGKGVVTLVSKTMCPPGSRIKAVFRFPPQPKGHGWLELNVAVENSGDAKDRGIFFKAIPQPPKPQLVNFVTDLQAGPGTPAEKMGKRVAYQFAFHAVRSLSWPETFRQRIEAELAQADNLNTHWFTLEAFVGEHQIEYHMDGIPLEVVAKADLQTQGDLRVILTGGAELASLSVTSWQPVAREQRFVPVDLSSLLNASEVDGQKLTLTRAGGADSVKVGEVPYQLPAPNGQGNDHVDVGVSWVKQAVIEGAFQGNTDSFGGRWTSAAVRDPSRLRLRVPQGRYRALHLLAVADREPDSVPIVTAQFYRPDAGFPVQFISPTVAHLDAAGSAANLLPVKTASGQKSLYHVVIPIDPGVLSAFADQPFLEIELTKQVQLQRSYPDPQYYSRHGAGLPSSVHIYAATLERTDVEMQVTAEAIGHVWTAPAKPTYTVTLRNRLGGDRPVQLTLTTSSYLDHKATTQKQTVNLTADGAAQTAQFTLDLPCYGYHDLTLTLTDGPQVWEEKRSLAFLHEDTRERGEWELGRGPLFGFWNWKGVHNTPGMVEQLTVMGQAGMETVHEPFYHPNAPMSEQATEVAKRFRFKSYKLAGGADHFATAKFATTLANKGLEAAKEELLAAIAKWYPPADGLHQPLTLSFFAEPVLNHFSHALPPEYYGMTTPPFTQAEEAKFQVFLNGLVEGMKIVKEKYPQAKCLMPHGSPLFPLPFLKRSEEARKTIDGIAIDIPAFEHMPEMQFHQLATHQMYPVRQEFLKAGIARPMFMTFEGPCVPTSPGARTQNEAQAIHVRHVLILLAYGVDYQSGGFNGFDCGNYWGEQHYGTGILSRLPLAMPHPSYATVATLTRILNRCNFDGWVPTGSLSTYAPRFKHYKTGELTHVFWTIRGTRTVTLTVPDGQKLDIRLVDPMDNQTKLTAQNGSYTFTIDASPRYVLGLPPEVKITLGEPDHSDSKPAAISRKLANLGDGAWTLSTEPQKGYENSHEPYVVRFPGDMSIAVTAAPAEQGGKALAVHLNQQPIDRVVMPYYTTLTPAKPIVIEGKSSHLGLWVKAASDWGRVVYFVRDAKGEQWIGVGQSGGWNGDDIHDWLSFNFDGWRYLRFEMPAHSPYDGFIENGSTWWGAYSRGDQTIDLPLQLEKIVVERRTHTMYVNDPQPARTDDVLLGDLYAEYASAADQSRDAHRLAALRMPLPQGVADLGNPIVDLTSAGQYEPAAITHITLPQQEADGRQCFVHFEKPAQAVTFDIWASPYPDGRGALQLSKGLKDSGGLVHGFRANTDFYLFLVFIDKDGKASKPSPAFKINLQDLFAQK